MKPYILDDASTLEYQRLDLMSKILDPWTRGYLTALGIGEGWQCLELGSANGSIAEWLSATVGPSGNVTAIDINPVLLELIPAQNLTVEQMDVRQGELRANVYDLVSCRALLHQISEYAPTVLAQMAAALKPGTLSPGLRSTVSSSLTSLLGIVTSSPFRIKVACGGTRSKSALGRRWCRAGSASPSSGQRGRR
jgi:ubiquinone/menaquinone biosynthesis C-methylase UbiE